VAWTLQFLDQVRRAIGDGTLAALRRDVRSVWG
jgi:hypothetical protein